VKTRVGIALIVLGLTLGGASAGHAESPTPPDQDQFYAQRSTIASAAQGSILDSREVTLTGFSQGAYSAAYQLLYRTTDHAGRPIAAVNTIILPSTPASGPRKLLSYQTYEDSLTTNCAPSYTLRGGSSGGSYPFSGTQHAEQAWISRALSNGWTVVVPDYEGPLSEQAIGPLEAHTTLDSIRAAEQFGSAELDGVRTSVGLIGYSGGAIPTVWANAFLAHYAPELRVVGAAAGGIPANVGALFPAFDGGAFSGASIGLLVSIQRAYPELGLDKILNDAGKALADQDAKDANGCGGSILNAPFQTADQWSVYPNMQALVNEPRVKAAFAHLNLIGGPTPSAPAYFWNAVNDELATIEPVDELFSAQCAEGAVIDIHREPAGEHVTGMAHYVPAAMDYLKARFEGQPAPNACPPRVGRPAPQATTPATGKRAQRRQLVVKRGTVAIRVSCPVQAARCTGSVTITSRGRVFGRREFALSNQRNKFVRVHVTARAMKQLRAHRTTRVTVKVRTLLKGRRSSTKSYPATLKL
jgi:hypothetical protein